MAERARDGRLRNESRPSVALSPKLCGAYYAEQRKFSEAERAYLLALEMDPKYYDSHSNLGDIYREQGNLRELKTTM
jgi:tetratricopeptide (TPR) repeat protein